MTEEPPCRIHQLPRTCARHAFSVAPQCCGAFLYFSRLTQGCARDSARFPWAIELSPPVQGAFFFTDRGHAVDIARAQHESRCAKGAISPASPEADIVGCDSRRCNYGEERACARREDRLCRSEDCAHAQSEDIPPVGGMRVGLPADVTPSPCPRATVQRPEAGCAMCI